MSKPHSYKVLARHDRPFDVDVKLPDGGCARFTGPHNRENAEAYAAHCRGEEGFKERVEAVLKKYGSVLNKEEANSRGWQRGVKMVLEELTKR